MYNEKAESLINEINEGNNGIRIYSWHRPDDTNKLWYMDEDGNGRTIGDYLTNKEMWCVVCAIGNLLNTYKFTRR